MKEAHVKEILVVATPMIKAVVDTFIAPKLEKLKKKLNKSIGLHLIPLEKHFQEYFYTSYVKNAILNTLVFSNSQRQLKDVFIPLTIRKSETKQITVVKGVRGVRKASYAIDCYPENIVSAYNKILITDTAGMGKTTLMKRIFLDIIDRGLGIPMIIELRRLSKEKTILTEIQTILNSIHQTFKQELMLELINEGDFIFILDGFDEIPPAERASVTKDLQQFIEKSPENKFFLTSRPESELTCFGDFQQFTIEPLKKMEAYELLRKYDDHGEVSRLLINQLKKTELSNIEEFLTNPLLVSLLFTAFEHKHVIPFKKHIFYRQVYDANFESHDLTKGGSFMRPKYSGLAIDDFHRVLRHIGYSCLKQQKIEFTKDELLRLVTESQDFCTGLKFSASDFVKDLLTTVPLFIQDGTYYRWAHRSLQEYFAAQFIYLDSKGQQNKILEKMYDSKQLENYANTLDIYYDIDPKTFRNVIIYKLLLEYKAMFQKNYRKGFQHIDQKMIQERKEMEFTGTLMLIYFGEESKSRTLDLDRLEIIMDLVRKKIGTKHLGMVRPTISLINTIKKDEITLVTIPFPNTKETILFILRKKKHDIITPIKLRDIRGRFPFESSINFENIEAYGLYTVNDKLDPIFNSKDNFKAISNLLSQSNPLYCKMNTKKAFALLAEIEAELAQEGDSDYLLDGIK